MRLYFAPHFMSYQPTLALNKLFFKLSDSLHTYMYSRTNLSYSLLCRRAASSAGCAGAGGPGGDAGDSRLPGGVEHGVMNISNEYKTYVANKKHSSGDEMKNAKTSELSITYTKMTK